MALENQKNSLEISLLKLKPLVFMVMNQSICNSCLPSPKARLFQLQPAQAMWIPPTQLMSLMLPMHSVPHHLIKSLHLAVSLMPCVTHLLSSKNHQSHHSENHAFYDKIHVNFRRKSCWFKCSLKPLIWLLRYYPSIFLLFSLIRERWPPYPYLPDARSLIHPIV